MTVDHPTAGPRPLAARFPVWERQLTRYPANRARSRYLAIVVVATVVLYYQLYVQGAVAPTIIADYHMSFAFYIDISVVGSVLGAFASLVAGLADRWGRANLVIYGLAVTSALVLWGLPNSGSKWSYAALYSVVAFVEGIILVATPALMRDFSPQVGRATAMGFWAVGPVAGSLIVAQVSSHTLGAGADWQSQFRYAGIAGFVAFAIAFLALRELSAGLRDQLMVTLRDRALVEARAKGLDVEAALRHPWRQMLRFEVVGSALAISVYLLIYYAAVGYFVIYFTTVFHYSEAKANGLGNWFWSAEAVSLVVVGVLSDRLRVRKPFMLAGAVGGLAMTVVFLTRATHPHTSYQTFVLVIALQSVLLGFAYAPWMASFTEAVEARSPALTATGLAVWGWIIRIVVAVSTFCIPLVVSSVTPLVDHGAQVAALASKDAAELATVRAIDPKTLAALASGSLAALPAAQAELTKAGLAHAPAQAISRLLAVQRVQGELGYLQKWGPQVAAASAAAPVQWQRWWWVCVGGEVAFLPFVFAMPGRWSPRRAAADAAAHDRLVALQLTELGIARA